MPWAPYGNFLARAEPMEAAARKSAKANNRVNGLTVNAIKAVVWLLPRRSQLLASKTWSAFRCRQPDSRAAVIQIKSPELTGVAHELNANPDFSGRNFA